VPGDGNFAKGFRKDISGSNLETQRSGENNIRQVALSVNASDIRRMNVDSRQLLAADDPPPVSIFNEAGASPFLLIGDHAGNVIPSALGTLGLPEEERVRHIAWDIGIAGLGRALASMLDAPFISQTYSRLVIDCNRAPDAADAIPAISDRTAIPANADLSAAERARRVAAIHAPYQAAIAAELARRDEAGRATTVIALHSFTPAMGGIARPWEIGVLHSDGDNRFALAVLAQLRGRAGLTVGDNEPYAMDQIDYTIPRHAFAARRPYVEIEIRQDLLAERSQQTEWAQLLAEVFGASAAAL
jgi:predicted N-formylglutamate amidohydrolase